MHLGWCWSQNNDPAEVLQEGTNVHFSNVHFVLCQIFGLNRLPSSPHRGIALAAMPPLRPTLQWISAVSANRNENSSWWVPNPPFANPGVAEKAPWQSLQSGVAGVYSLLEIPTDSYHC